MLDKGKIIFEGETEKIEQTEDPEVHAFIHGLEPSQDEMTGMTTTHQGARRFMEDMARLDQHNIAFTLVVMTLKNLDEINESLGYVTGQTVMKNFAIEVRKRLRITDTCSRYRLNKIMIVRAASTVAEARNFCEQLAGDLRAADIMPLSPYPGFCLSVDAGFAEAEQGARIEEVLASAEATEGVLYEFTSC
jgi:phospholipid/cholesterol/gamma-HCH transport system ATP-binding protein